MVGYVWSSGCQSGQPCQPGDNSCHNECNQGQCTCVNSPGVSNCFTDSDCIKPKVLDWYVEMWISDVKTPLPSSLAFSSDPGDRYSVIGNHSNTALPAFWQDSRGNGMPFAACGNIISGTPSGAPQSGIIPPTPLPGYPNIKSCLIDFNRITSSSTPYWLIIFGWKKIQIGNQPAKWVPINSFDTKQNNGDSAFGVQPKLQIRDGVTGYVFPRTISLTNGQYVSATGGAIPIPLDANVVNQMINIISQSLPPNLPSGNLPPGTNLPSFGESTILQFFVPTSDGYTIPVDINGDFLWGGPSKLLQAENDNLAGWFTGSNADQDRQILCADISPVMWNYCQCALDIQFAHGIGGAALTGLSCSGLCSCFDPAGATIIKQQSSQGISTICPNLSDQDCIP